MLISESGGHLLNRVSEFNNSVDISREDEAEVLGRVEVTWKVFDQGEV
jgi:hypothetical protein